MIELKNVTKIYDPGGKEVRAIQNLSLQIQSGQFVSIMGPSGSGKSTLLHLIGALDRLTSGEIFIQNQELHKLNDNELSLFRRRHVGFIFQSFNLLPTLTALENVTLPLLLDGKSLSSIIPKAEALLEKVRLNTRKNHRPDELSGGEMQRVAICRALVHDPTLILADEPTGNLDSKTGGEILQLLQTLQKDQRCTVVMVTHDERAARYGDRIIQLRDGQLEV
ncbi:MAG: ABC transporter ATP-binding protein [Deltaproteobacteria bacterium]|nr:ABC transporter ATP-binding protein [Deltaproteobacteria bacterium]